MKLIYSLLLVFSVCFNSYSEQALALYKSSEGTTDKENEIIWHLKTPMHMLGYKLKMHDIDKGLPNDKDVQQSSVIISWYRSAEMPNALTYVNWLVKQIKNKKKLLVFGNFGAFKDKQSNKYVKDHQLNLFFEEFGYKFLGNWTNQSTKLKVEKFHPLLNQSAKRGPFRKLNDYLQYKSMSENNLNLAVINRTDLKDGKSVVIGISTKGSMALHPYILQQTRDKRGFIYSFEMKRFLKMAIEYKSVNSKHILCLYKSKDGQDDKENEINWHLSNSLKKNGFSLSFHDMSLGLPSKTHSDAGAVISWFRSAEMNNPLAYIEYIERIASRGAKVIVLGNMGAHRDRKKHQWLDGKEINRVYSILGVDFKGQWTNKPELIDFIKEDSNAFKNSVGADIDSIAHYIHIKPVHSSVKPLLELKRNDQKDSLSIPVFVSAFGAYAENSYIFGVKSKPYLDIKKLVLDVLLKK